jgi:hypothetical protein
MTSWRDTTSVQAQDDLDGLLDPALSFATSQLEKRGAFYPYAVVVLADGGHKFVMQDLKDTHPTSAQIITSLIVVLTDQREELRATAIVADARIREQSCDTVRVTLEHREGQAMNVLLPYRKRRFRAGIEYYPIETVPADTYIW